MEHTTFCSAIYVMGQRNSGFFHLFGVLHDAPVTISLQMSSTRNGIDGCSASSSCNVLKIPLLSTVAVPLDSPTSSKLSPPCSLSSTHRLLPRWVVAILMDMRQHLSAVISFLRQ